jgi:hypothetical protein
LELEPEKIRCSKKDIIGAIPVPALIKTTGILEEEGRHIVPVVIRHRMLAKRLHEI